MSYCLPDIYENQERANDYSQDQESNDWEKQCSTEFPRELICEYGSGVVHYGYRDVVSHDTCKWERQPQRDLK
jgi:hypothetical protein